MDWTKAVARITEGLGENVATAAFLMDQDIIHTDEAAFSHRSLVLDLASDASDALLNPPRSWINATLYSDADGKPVVGLAFGARAPEALADADTPISVSVAPHPLRWVE